MACFAVDFKSKSRNIFSGFNQHPWKFQEEFRTLSITQPVSSHNVLVLLFLTSPTLCARRVSVILPQNVTIYCQRMGGRGCRHWRLSCGFMIWVWLKIMGKPPNFNGFLMIFPIKTAMFGGHPRSSDKAISGFGSCVVTCCSLLGYFDLFWKWGCLMWHMWPLEIFGDHPSTFGMLSRWDWTNFLIFSVKTLRPTVTWYWTQTASHIWVPCGRNVRVVFNMTQVGNNCPILDANG